MESVYYHSDPADLHFCALTYLCGDVGVWCHSATAACATGHRKGGNFEVFVLCQETWHVIVLRLPKSLNPDHWSVFPKIIRPEIENRVHTHNYTISIPITHTYHTLYIAFYIDQYDKK